MLLSLSSHFMRYPLPLLLLSDFIYRSDLIHNLLQLHMFILTNYIAMLFHTLVLDHSRLRFMLFYYIRFQIRLLLLLLALFYLYSLLHYLYNSSYFLLCRLSLHYMFIHYLLYYMFIILLKFMLHYLYFLLMSHLHFMSYNYLTLENMSNFHMSVPSYRMYMSLFL